VENSFPYAITETLSEGYCSRLYRATRRSDRLSVILKVLDPKRCRPKDLDRQRSEYEIGQTLGIPAVAKPLALEMYQGLPMLIIEDFGGQPLDSLLGVPFPLERFLSLAIRIAGAVADIHRHGVIHKDLKPQNILVNPATGEVRLTDFGLASRLPREQQAAWPPHLIEGSLPYMSPEQTGRMNVALDDRSDLYSLGVTFYQMLTGSLPYDAHDPLEWVHAHVARTPSSPSEVSSQVPQMLARIVLKLLAKRVEDRYQSARGLQHDLERCLEQWGTLGRIEPFPLGERDASDRLRIPQKIYGREEERALLLRAFEHVAATGTPELLLLSGYSGIGKSALVHELQKPLVRERGLFLGGKFDQFARGVPYSTIVRSLTALVLGLLAEDESRLRGWREEVQKALGAHGRLLIDVIPPLKLLIGEQPAVPELPLTEAELRFRGVFRDFLGVFTKKQHPLVFFLDDLQWADTGSLRLIEDVITHPDTRYLLLIGAYRDNEVSPSHPLMQTLERIWKTPTVVEEVVLSPLGVEQVNALVAETVHADPAHARPLAVLVHEKTGGNPLFAIQFLTALYREHLLEFDEGTQTWRWDIARIQEKGYTDNVVDFMARRMSGLSAATQDILGSAACIGNKVQSSLLALVRGKPEQELQGDLSEAIQEGLILPSQGMYAFAHDRIQHAAYSLLPEDRRREVHLRIGRLLLAHSSPEEREERMFDIVTQLNLGTALVTAREERTQVAELNLHVARKAKAAVAYRAASGYLSAGAALLGGDAWERQYPLMYALLLERAECEFLDGNFHEAERLFPGLLQHARSLVDKAAVYRVKIDTLTTKGEDGEAILDALECLRMFGISMSAHPSSAEVEEAYQEVWRNLGTRRIEELIDLPLMTDPGMQAAMEILARLYAPAYHSDNNLFYLHLCHGVNLSLRHGNSAASTHAYGWFGIILACVFHRSEDGYRFARLAFNLMLRHRFLAYKAKAYFQLRIISYWTQPLDKMLEYSRAAFEAAVETGDVPVACFSCNHTLMGMLIRGVRLSEIHRDAARCQDFVRKAGFRDVHDMIVGIERFVQTMRGRTRQLSTYDDDRFSEASFESTLAKGRMPTLLFYYYTVKLMARVLSCDYEAALAAGEKSRDLLWAGLFSAQGQCFYFYYALALAAVFDTRPPEQQKEALEILTAHQEQLRGPAESYPPTFYHPYALVSAELARIRGQNDDAMRLYAQALRSARENGFVQNEGLAYEFAARFYRARGFDHVADAYLREARSCYATWGADGKVEQLEHLHPSCLLEQKPAAPTATFALQAEQLDLLSVVKASQTISGEIVLDKLLRTLLKVVLEQSGAQRGYLLLTHNGELSIEAEATLDESEGRAAVRQPLPVGSSSPLLPASIVKYVQRTKERVILDDAAAAGKFSSDEYLSRTKPRSLLCLPILRQAEVVGVLYLENDLLTGVFTPERLMALELLATQAAISVENATLLAKEQAARSAAEEERSRSAFLAEAGELLAESLDTDETLVRLARLCVRSLADWCVIDVLLDSQEIQRVAGAHAEPAKEPLIRKLQQRYPPRWDSPHPSARVLRSGEPLLLPEVSGNELRSFCEDDEHLQLIRELGIRTALAVPLAARGQTLGVISLSSASPGRSYGRAELELAQELARRAATAVDNARLYCKAQEAVRLRDEFLSIASHELYTPMTSLMLSLQGLAAAVQGGQPVDSKALRKRLELVSRQGQRLVRLIGELLDVSRIKAGRILLELADVELGALVRDVVERLEPDLVRAQCTLSIQASAPVTGRWDRSRLDQVTTNLLSNAIKFGAGRPIEIFISEEAGVARLTVRDHGIGISPALRSRIFDRFERAVPVRHYGGLGLGLYISLRIAEAHGGTIRVESQPGAGAEFTVELPCAGPPEAAEQARRREGDVQG
jgi:predicted ATPase/signal transduction histidine kinase/tRNA A-37 threonylcarbamoyl transferase component Bud32